MVEVFHSFYQNFGTAELKTNVREIRLSPSSGTLTPNDLETIDVVDHRRILLAFILQSDI